MSVVEKGLLKGCKGRIGEYVIYECRGKTCIRRVPGKEKILLTPEMLEQQERMAGADGAELDGILVGVGVEHDSVGHGDVFLSDLILGAEKAGGAP